MTEIVTVLLGLISVGVTIVGLALGYLIRQLHKLKEDDIYPMKEKVNTMWNTFFGIESQEGFLDEAGDRHDSMRVMIEETRKEQNQSHNEISDAFVEIERYLRELVRSLDNQNVDVPHPDKEIDDDKLFSGDD